MKKILLPTDFSENSWNAIDYAVELFKEEECVFYLLNAYSKIIYGSIHESGVPSDLSIENTVKVNAISNLEHLKTIIKGTNPNTNHQFNVIAAFGSLSEVIGDTVKKEKIDLIVMGTKGVTGGKEVFMGSNTVRIINSIKNCPVLAIPESFRFISKPSEITFATDFNHFYSKEELQPLLDLAKSFHADVRILYLQQEGGSLSEEQKFNLRMLKKYLIDADIEHYQYTLTRTDSIAKSLRVFTEELQVYLLAMLNYKHSYLKKLTREPVIKKLALNTEIPFLILPELGMSSTFTKVENRNERAEVV